MAELERVLKLELDPSRVMLGINNRDLQTFKVDLDNNRRIMESSAGQQVRKFTFCFSGVASGNPPPVAPQTLAGGTPGLSI